MKHAKKQTKNSHPNQNKQGQKQYRQTACRYSAFALCAMLSIAMMPACATLKSVAGKAGDIAKKNELGGKAAVLAMPDQGMTSDIHKELAGGMAFSAEPIALGAEKIDKMVTEIPLAGPLHGRFYLLKSLQKFAAAQMWPTKAEKFSYQIAITLGDNQLEKTFTADMPAKNTTTSICLISDPGDADCPAQNWFFSEVLSKVKDKAGTYPILVSIIPQSLADPDKTAGVIAQSKLSITVSDQDIAIAKKREAEMAARAKAAEEAYAKEEAENKAKGARTLRVTEPEGCEFPGTGMTIESADGSSTIDFNYIGGDSYYPVFPGAKITVHNASGEPHSMTENGPIILEKSADNADLEITVPSCN